MREMKDSGVEWIGKIPKDWGKTSIKHGCLILSSGTTPASGHQEYYANGTINWIQSGDLYNNPVILSTSKKITNEALNNTSTLKIYQAPFIVIAMYGASVGNVSISEIDACCNQACCCIKTNERLAMRFLMYWLLSCKDDFLIKAVGGGQPNISQNIIQNESIFLPIIKEQKCIVNFLDTKCAEIDSISEDIRKEIETLQEYRKSVITEAVTKGLDPNVEMQDSGVEWIGIIPKEWNISQISFFSFSCSGATPDRQKAEYWREGNIPWMSSGEVNKTLVFETKESITELATLKTSAKVLPVNSVMVALNGQGKTKGMSAILKIRAACNQSLCAFQCDESNLHYRYLFYSFQSMYKFLRSQAGDELRDGLAASFVRKQKIALPPVGQQLQISDYLDTKCAEIDSIISDKQKQLDILAEYRKSLIYEYVTGKKEVV